MKRFIWLLKGLGFKYGTTMSCRQNAPCWSHRITEHSSTYVGKIIIVYSNPGTDSTKFEKKADLFFQTWLIKYVAVYF